MSIEEKPNLSDLTIASEQRTRGSAKFTVAFLLILVASGLGGVRYWNREKVVDVPVVMVKWVSANQAISVLKATGYVTPRRKATIAAKITGRISQLFVEEGMRVEKDQILAKLDDTDAIDTVRIAESDLQVSKAALAELRANFSDAQKKLTRAKDLYTKTILSKEDFETLETAVHVWSSKIQLAEKQIASSRVRLLAARRNCENYTIQAPFAGIVVSKDAQIGEIVSPVSSGGFTRTGIATIVDMDSLEIEVDVNESYIARVQDKQKAEAVLDAYPEWEIPAHVRTVIPTADRQKATVKVRILFDRLDPKILPDMGVKVSFLEKQIELPDRHFLVIPQSAVVIQDGKSFVFVLKEDHVEQRHVQTGSVRGQEVEVKSGIVEGDAVVVDNITALKDGQKARRLP